MSLVSINYAHFVPALLKKKTKKQNCNRVVVANKILAVETLNALFAGRSQPFDLSGKQTPCRGRYNVVIS